MSEHKKFLAVVAYRDGGSTTFPFRRRNLKAVIARWVAFGKCDVVVSEQVRPGETDPHPDLEELFSTKGVHRLVTEIDDERFHKPLLLNNAIQKYGDGFDYIVMADADALLDDGAFEYLDEHCGDSPLVFPYSNVLYLDETDTRRVLRGEPYRKGVKDHGVVITRQTGLCNVFTMDTYRKIGGFDNDFAGWGAEDDAFMIKVRRICGEISRNFTNYGTVLHLFHPKVNTTEYIKGNEYVENRKRAACIRRMSDSDLGNYVTGKITLAELVSKYAKMGRLEVELKWHCTPTSYLCIDTTIYDLPTEGVTFTKILDEVRSEDSSEYVVQFIDGILYKLTGLTDEQKAEIDGYRARMVAECKGSVAE